MQDIKDLKNVVLKEFPLKNGGVLYFSPSSLGLLEADPLVGRLLHEIPRVGSIDELTSALLGEYPEERIIETVDQLNYLQKQGIIGENNDEWHYKDHAGPVIRFIISNTSACNLACRYCYNSFEENAGGFAEKHKMDKALLTKAMGLLGEISGSADELELLFIGGEPLMAFDLIAEAAELRHQIPSLAEKVVRIFLITNATLLNDEIYDFCTLHNIHIKISLDGPSHIHDKMRIFPGGTGSHKSVMEKLPGYFWRYGHPCKAVTATVDSFRQDLPAMVEYFTALGFNQLELTELYGCDNLCRDRSAGSGEKAVELDYPSFSNDIVSDNYKRICDFLEFKILSRQYLHIIPLYGMLYNLHFRVPGHYPCRTGLDSAALFSDGVFYPCHHYMGDGINTMGHVESGIDQSRFDSLRLPVNLRKGCSVCWARNLCGGACYHRANAAADNPYGTDEKTCQRIKEACKNVIYLYHRLREKDPSALEWYFSVNMYP